MMECGLQPKLLALPGKDFALEYVPELCFNSNNSGAEW
jgi:hypothetical protein